MSRNRSSRVFVLSCLGAVLCALQVVGLGLAAGCVSTSPAGELFGEHLMRFSEVAKLLPSGHQSYVLQAPASRVEDAGALLALFSWDSWGDDDQPILAMAGSNFDLPEWNGPMSASHIFGTADGVFVIDFGERGIQKQRKCLSGWIPANGAADARGVVRISRKDNLRVGSWPIACAIDDRFVVGASSEEELDRALSRSNDLAHLVGCFPALALIREGFDYIVCRKGTQERPRLRSTFTPAQDIVLSVSIRGGDWVLFYEDSLRLGPPNRTQAWLTTAETVDRCQGKWTARTYPGGHMAFRRVGLAHVFSASFFESWKMRNMLFGFSMPLWAMGGA